MVVRLSARAMLGVSTTSERFTAGFVTSVVATAAAIAFLVRWQRRQLLAEVVQHSSEFSSVKKGDAVIIFGTYSGTAKTHAHKIKRLLQTRGASVAPVLDMTKLDAEELPSLQRKGVRCVCFLLSTYTDGAPPPLCGAFLQLLEELVHDFRVGKAFLNGLRFAVVGLGSDAYDERNFCAAAKRLRSALLSLSAVEIAPFLELNDARNTKPPFITWCSSLLGQVSENAMVEPAQNVNENSNGSSESESAEGGDGMDEMEDLADGGCASESPEMLSKRQRQQLLKEHYKLIGSHSAVKLCRWTKAQLRGRGGCYKHSFYGIVSYQCMEATPSLACANKCTFCWRHHKNPVGKEWKWKTDPPDFIVKEALENHRALMNEAKGVLGARKDRLVEALTVKHCALSLVGEPIMYPEINRLVDELHQRDISTFLVTNAQFPDLILKLAPVTQLYVSVDAANPIALKEVDRPLHSDYWERFIESLKALRAKNQRTVYRLTLVKDENMSDPAEYANLVRLGSPDFIEIKAVTFCGKSATSKLTVGNTPWYDEVIQFAQELLENIPSDIEDTYEIACEHQHSNIVLLAKTCFKINNQWHTWIDYEKYNDLVRSGLPFGAMDYIAPTPNWACYGSEEKGFSPHEVRLVPNRLKKKMARGKYTSEQMKLRGYDL